MLLCREYHEVCRIDREKLHDRLAQAKQGVAVTPSYNGWENVMNDAGMLYGIAQYQPVGGKGIRAITMNGKTLYAAGYFSGDIHVAKEMYLMYSGSWAVTCLLLPKEEGICIFMMRH